MTKVSKPVSKETSVEALKVVDNINRLSHKVIIITTSLDGFRLANFRRFAKFAKLSPRQTFPLYGIDSTVQSNKIIQLNYMHTNI